jgi:hypothetical protein
VSHPPHLLANRPASPPRKRPGRRVASLLLAAGLTLSAMTVFAASPASAASVCDPGTDICAITDTVQTPLGPVTIAVSAASVVTVQLSPAAPRTLVFGIPFAIPPGPPGLPGYARTSITTAGGVVNIDTFLAPPGVASWFALAIISIHPPGPCRVGTSGTTVVFTPIIPPGPPA